MQSSRQVVLAARPRGFPGLDDFAIRPVHLRDPADGQVLVRNIYMSVDPYMRGRMDDAPSYIPPFALGQPLEGGAIGEVLESATAGLRPGDVVLSNFGWREHFLANANEVRRVERIAPLTAYLGVLGVPGMTAWVGLNLVDVRAGDRVFVSAAAGAVGSIAGQLAKLRGCRVVGSAGSGAKVKMLVEEFGFDAAFNYHDGDIAGQLAAAAPDGIDVYFDNVGGEHLEVALSAMRLHGRVVACGAISRYNETEPPPGPRNLQLVIGKRLTIRGFILMDWLDKTPAFLREVGGLVSRGRLRAKETIVEGLDQAPRALLDMLKGANVGKMLVKLA
jgi:NADPH-dependent curcumin reductase CurA